MQGPVRVGERPVRVGVLFDTSAHVGVHRQERRAREAEPVHLAHSELVSMIYELEREKQGPSTERSFLSNQSCTLMT